MYVNVPQYTDVEDKIAFGLTGKQLLWLGAMGGAIVVLRAFLEKEAFYFASFFVVIIFCTFAFWKPQGVSLATFIGYIFNYFLQPRDYLWKRQFEKSESIDVRKALREQRKKNMVVIQKKSFISSSNLKRLSWILDTGGKIGRRL